MSLGNEVCRVGTAADDHQVLVTRRFNISWSPSAVEAGGDEALRAFRTAHGSLLSCLRTESAHEPVDRTEMLLAFAAIMNTDGSSVTYRNRNTRYTNVGGILMSEPIEPSLPMDVARPLGGIPNPLNYPVQDKPNL